MSWLSNVTGIGINPLGKTKIKIDPLKAIGTALTVGSMGGLGPVAGALAHIPGAAAIAGGVSKVGALAKAIPGVSKAAGLYNTLKAGNPLAGKSLPGVGTTDQGMIGDAQRANGIGGESTGGGFLDKIIGAVHDVRKASGAPPITLKNTLGGLGGMAKNALGGLAKNPLEYAGAAAAGANGAAAFKRAGDYSDKAVKTAEDSYSERAGLRKLGVAGMSKPTAQAPQDFVNTANPFATKRKIVPNATARIV